MQTKHFLLLLFQINIAQMAKHVVAFIVSESQEICENQNKEVNFITSM